MNNNAPRTGQFQSQRLTLSYVEWGAPDAAPLFLVHGGWDQKRSWDDVARHLAKSYRVIAHDLRGHGASEWVSDGDYGVMDHVFDLASLIDHIGAENPIIVSHSLGGNISLRYTGLYPERVKKLVAIEGLGPSPKLLEERKSKPVDERLREWIDQRRQLSDKSSRVMANLDEAIERMKARHKHLPDALVRHLSETGVKTNPDGTVSWAYDPAGLGKSPSDITPEEFQTLWTKITCPTWLVYGADSWASDPSKDGRADKFSNATVTVMENAGHWLHHDQFDTFIAGLDKFLAA